MLSSFRALSIATLVLAGCAAGTGSGPAAVASETPAQAADPMLRPAAVPFPPDNEPNAARIALGRALFFDPRLSGSAMISCATCHNPALAWGDGQPTAVGDGAKRLGRATPTILNTAYQPLQMWDGRKNSLEDQALGPIGSPAEMNMPLEKMTEHLSAIPGYVPMFAQAYPGEAISPATVAKAIASFERTVVSTESPFDRWRKGDAQAVGDDVKRGYALFTGKARCALCHQGWNFTDNGFHNIGLRTLPGESEDDGRFAHRKIKVLKGAFKTPTLRDIALTAPYMHNGSYRTLEEVVDHYDRGGDDKSNLSPNIQPLGLSAQEKKDLVAFMKSLTGAPMAVEVPRLPAS
jgi:cytochrome c peroxidase